MDEQTPEQDGISRRSALKRGAIVGGALVWTTPVVQSLAGPAFAGNEVGSPGPDDDDEQCGWFTGGGQPTRGGQADINYGLGPLYCGVTNYTQTSLTVNYTATDGEVVVFKLTSYSSTCGGDGNPSPETDFDTIEISGVGTVDGQTATFEAVFVDNGEPGTEDRASITIFVATDSPLNLTLADTTVFNGNLQAHKATGSANQPCVAS